MGQYAGLVDEYERLIILYGEASDKGQFYQAVINQINEDLKKQEEQEIELNKIREEQTIKGLINAAGRAKELENIQAQLGFNQLESHNSLDAKLIQKQKETNEKIEALNKKSNDNIVQLNYYKNLQILQATSELLASASDLFGQDTAAYKITASAGALISAYLAINKTLADPKLDFPANVIAATAIGS